MAAVKISTKTQKQLLSAIRFFVFGSSSFTLSSAFSFIRIRPKHLADSQQCKILTKPTIIFFIYQNSLIKSSLGFSYRKQYLCLGTARYRHTLPHSGSGLFRALCFFPFQYQINRKLCHMPVNETNLYYHDIDVCMTWTRKKLS